MAELRFPVYLTAAEAHALKDAANCLWFAQNDPACVMGYFGRDDATSREIADRAADAADLIDLALRANRRSWVDAAIRESLRDPE